MKETVRRENRIKGGKGRGEREGRIFRDGRRKTVLLKEAWGPAHEVFIFQAGLQSPE